MAEFEKKNVDDLLKKDLQEYARELEARLEKAEDARESDSPDSSELLARLEALEAREAALMSALNVEREAKDRLRKADRAPGEETYTVENIVGMNVWVRVHDHRGVEIRKQFQGKGSSHDLTAGQIAEIKNDRPDLFERGILSAPDVVPDSVNAIRDFDAFLDEGSIEEVSLRVRELTDLNTLMSLNDYIEAKKFRAEDEEGRPLQIEEQDGTKHAVLEEVQIPARYAAIQATIRERIGRLGDIDLSDG